MWRELAPEVVEWRVEEGIGGRAEEHMLRSEEPIGVVGCVVDFDEGRV